MPELSQAIGYRLQPKVFEPIAPSSYFNRQLPVQAAVPVDKAAKAGVFSSLVKALGELPGQLNKQWDEGKKRGQTEAKAERQIATEKDVRSKFGAAMTGKAGANDPQLADFAVNADGGVVMKVEDPEVRRARIAHLKAVKDASAAANKPSLHSKEESTFGVGGGVSGGVDDSLTLPVKDAASTLNTDPLSEFPADPTPGVQEHLIPGSDTADDTDTGADLSSFSPSVPADQVAQINAGVQNAVGQLSGLGNDQLTASNEPAGQPADIQPPETNATPPHDVFGDEDTEVRKALPVTGRTVNHRTGEIYLRSENGAVKTYDPITRNITLKTADGRHFVLLPGANTWKEEKDLSASGTKPSALLMREAAGMGINTDGMTNGQISEAMSATEKEQGIIRPSRLPVAQSLARLVMNHPTLKHYPTVREAKETVDAGLANQDTGGFSDMAIVEGFQRMVNPGATVRSQTMAQMLKAAGLGQYMDLGYIIDHFKTGDKFAPEVRARLSKLSDAIYKNTVKNAEPQLKGLKRIAKSYGITDPDSFIDNVMVMTPVLAPGESAPGVQAAAPAAAAATGGNSHANPTVVTSQEQYDALPSGTWVSDGKKVGKKP